MLIVFKDGHETEYVYSATGEKLRVIYTTAKPHVITREIGKDITERLPENYRVSTPETVDYLLGGALTLRNGVIDKYQFEEGYCQATTMYDNNKKPIAESFTFCYYDQDHLGNIRQVIEDDGSSKGKVIQKMNYYPFGAEFCDNGTKSYVQNHKYNGKEFDNMHGLNTYDYGARQYNPVTARWDRMDPLCEKYYNISPYNYCLNNPIKLVDPDGKAPGPGDFFQTLDDASVLILENSDSIIYTPAMHGNYAGIAFYLLDSVNTIYIPRGLDFFQTDSDSIQGYIKTRPSAVSYKIKNNKYEIKDLQQSAETLEYDYSILGSNYWFFEGNIDERGGGYSFHYSRSNSNQIYPTLEAISQNSIEKNVDSPKYA